MNLQEGDSLCSIHWALVHCKAPWSFDLAEKCFTWPIGFLYYDINWSANQAADDLAKEGVFRLSLFISIDGSLPC